jgi:hypothetical protein
MLNGSAFPPCATLNELNSKLYGWYYDLSSSTLYVKARHSSSVEVYVDWVAPGTTSPISRYTLVVKTMNGSEVLPNVKVEVGSTVAFTDAMGTAVFMLPSGTYTVTATYNGKVLSKTVTLTANDVVVFNFEPQQQPLPVLPTPTPRTGLDPSTLILLILVAVTVWLYTKSRRRRR